MSLITLDFETYYDKDFNLKRLTTEAYIRDPQFEVIGVGVQIDDGQPEWFSGDNKQVSDYLHSLNIPEHTLLCHHAAFDGAILSWNYGLRPKYYFDTLSMAKPITGQTVGGSLAALSKKFNLGAKGVEVVKALGKRRLDFGFSELHEYGEYCKNDVVLTYKLFDVLKEYSTKKEMYIIDLMIRMYTDPVLQLDKELLVKHLNSVQLKKEKLMAKIDESIGRDALMSNPQFAEVLKKLGVEPPTKVSLRTNKEAYAFGKTDVEFKALLEHEDERVQAVVAARLGIKSTLEETRTQSFIGIAERGALPIMLNYYGAHTGRASGGDKVNLQNLPRGGELRQSIKAPKGHKLVAVDSSQIEARVVAWLAGEDELVGNFAKGEDIYSKFATEVYGRPITKADKIERFVGKTCLAEGTLVLCNNGWKPIESVTTNDELWDGEEWVCHQGLVMNGTKETLNLCGIWLTPDHQVWSGTKWLDAQSVVQDENILSQVLGTAAENLPLQAMLSDQEVDSVGWLLSAAAMEKSTQLTHTTLKTLNQQDATSVQSKRQLINDIGNTAVPCLMMSIERDSLIGYRRRFQDAIQLHVKHINTTVGEALQYVASGAKIALSSLSMYKPLAAGMSQNMRWTEQTLTATTNQEISDSYQEVQTYTTNEKLASLRKKLKVYDLACSGPRNRFTVLSSRGPVIVHNCILGLGYGMGKDKFRSTLKVGQAGVSVDIDEAEAERVVKLYRSKYAKIVELWKDGEKALCSMVDGFGFKLGRIGLVCDSEGIALPNGMMMRYNQLRRESGALVYETRYGANKIYGGKAIENVVQALARIVVFDQMAKIDQHFRKLDTPEKRYKVVLTVHDEIVVVVPDEAEEEIKQLLINLMSLPPSWAANLPVACEGESGISYGDCK